MIVTQPTPRDFLECLEKIWPFLRQLYPSTDGTNDVLKKKCELRWMLDESISTFLFQKWEDKNILGFCLVGMVDVEQLHM